MPKTKISVTVDSELVEKVDQLDIDASRSEIVELAPNAELVERWKEPDVVADAVRRVREFLRRHTP